MKGTFIYWKWKDAKTFSKAYVQEVIQTTSGTLLELTDSSWYSQYPKRVLEKDVDILSLEGSGKK